MNNFLFFLSPFFLLISQFLKRVALPPDCSFLSTKNGVIPGIWIKINEPLNTGGLLQYSYPKTYIRFLSWTDYSSHYSGLNGSSGRTTIIWDFLCSHTSLFTCHTKVFAEKPDDHDLWIQRLAQCSGIIRLGVIS